MARWVPQPGGEHPGPCQDSQSWSPQTHTWMSAGPKGPHPDPWPPFDSLPPQGLAFAMWCTHRASSLNSAWAQQEQQAVLQTSGKHTRCSRSRAGLTQPVCLESSTVHPAWTHGAVGSSLSALLPELRFHRTPGQGAGGPHAQGRRPLLVCGVGGAHSSTSFLRFQRCLHVAPGMCLCEAKLSDEQLPATPASEEPVLSPLTWPLCGSSSLRFESKTQKSETSQSL